MFICTMGQKFEGCKYDFMRSIPTFNYVLSTDKDFKITFGSKVITLNKIQKKTIIFVDREIEISDEWIKTLYKGVYINDLYYDIILDHDISLVEICKEYDSGQLYFTADEAWAIGKNLYKETITKDVCSDERKSIQKKIKHFDTYERFSRQLGKMRKIMLESRELIKNGFLRASGAIAGVVLEKHLEQVYINHNILNK